MKKVIIIGAGVSGLTIGYELQALGMDASDVTVLEKADSAGGNVKTDHIDGYTIEHGPNGFLDNSPATLKLVDRLGIDFVLQSNQSAARRFIFRQGKLREIDTSPVRFLANGVLPLGGALRVGLEPFIKKGGSETESVYEFARRRIGAEAADILVSSMVQGVFAGDATKLELKSAFPKMFAMEQQYGSLVKAMMAKRRQKTRHGGPAGPSGKLTSFDNGMHTLPNHLAAAIGDSLTTGFSVAGVEKHFDRFVVTSHDGRQIEAQTVVCAAPAWSAAAVLQQISPALCAELNDIFFPPVAVVAMGFDATQLSSVPNGFGFLAPRNQGVRVLGCLWSSSVWKHRAPSGKVLLRTMVGGAVDVAAGKLSDDELVAIVQSDLRTTMGIDAQPELIRVYRYAKAIAQYNSGHHARVNRIERLFSQIPGLFLSGSSYFGISVNHCVEEAPGVAAAIYKFLKEHNPG